MWTSRRTKIIVNIAMTIFLFLSFIRWETERPAFHLIVGTACALFFAAHIFIHRKWLVSVTKSYLANKINPTLAGKYRIDVILLVVWGICIITGFLALGALLGGIEWMFIFSRIHGVTARLGFLFTVIHIFQHRAQILSYLTKKTGAAKTAPASVSMILFLFPCLLRLCDDLLLHMRRRLFIAGKCEREIAATLGHGAQINRITR